MKETSSASAGTSRGEVTSRMGYHCQRAQRLDRWTLVASFVTRMGNPLCNSQRKASESVKRNRPPILSVASVGSSIRIGRLVYQLNSAMASASGLS